MKKRTLLVLIVVSAGLTAGIAIVVWSRSAITAENAAKIEVGMDLAAVEDLLGGPARNESTGPLTTESVVGEAEVKAWRAVMSGVANKDAREWLSNELIIWVDFDERACVDRCEMLPVHRVPRSPWNTVRRWLRL